MMQLARARVEGRSDVSFFSKRKKTGLGLEKNPNYGRLWLKFHILDAVLNVYKRNSF